MQKDELAVIIADALGHSFEDAHRNKAHWIETGGMLGGRFRDVNDLRQDDFLDAAAAVRAYANREDVVERARQAIAQVPTWDGDTFAHNCTREELDDAARAAINAMLGGGDAE